MDWLCERCGETRMAEILCRCQQPHDPVAARRRLREAVRRARLTDETVRHRREAA